MFTMRVASRVTAVLFVCVLGVSFAGAVQGASWQGIEPLKSRRADVERALGRPLSEAADGALRFNVIGGSVQISFVDGKFVVAKKLRPELEGTVLQIILQHERSSDTPESMKLLKKSAFVREDKQNISIFRNPKDGIVYTFIDSKLKTTRYTFADGQLPRARR
ncbi:MAG: hypothetical protein AABM67_09515 [Acidobacteriota bacterium]